MQIGILGGFGKFGGRINQRLQKEGFNTVRSEDKEDNERIASDSDLTIICVPKEAVANVATEISSASTEVLSFAAGAPISNIRKESKKKVTRAMSDPFFIFAAYFGDSNKGIEILKHIADLVAELESEEQLDEFTLDLTIFFVLLSVDPNSSTFNQSKSKIESYFESANIDQVIESIPKNEIAKLIQTKGGLSEAALNLLRANSVITYRELKQFLSLKFK